ncbi:MAG: ATP-binding protein [Actinomycetota bacterium]
MVLIGTMFLIRPVDPDLLFVAAAWLSVVAVADLVPVPVWSSIVLTMSLPILLAAGMVLPPHVAAIVALLGSVDPREFRREIGLARALFNRSQVALSTLAAALTFQLFQADPLDWPKVALIACLALVGDLTTNVLLVSAPAHMTSGIGLLEVVRRMIGTEPRHRLAGYLCCGLLAPVLALLFVEIGIWGLIAGLAPIFMAREVFAQNHRFREASTRVVTRSRALAHALTRISEERRQERLFLAGDLHDEVLQPLYKVHLMGQVLRRDLESGRLLDLDDDLPGLLAATESAQEAIRAMVRDLRTSRLGVAGLVGTLRLLLREFEEDTGIQVEVEAEEVSGSGLSELVAYQAAREALANVRKHSGASWIEVSVSRQDGWIRVAVVDDGRGFEPELVDGDEHLGLLTLRERVESLGGVLQIVSSVGKGTAITALVPARSGFEE